MAYIGIVTDRIFQIYRTAHCVKSERVIRSVDNTVDLLGQLRHFFYKSVAPVIVFVRCLSRRPKLHIREVLVQLPLYGLTALEKVLRLQVARIASRREKDIELRNILAGFNKIFRTVIVASLACKRTPH